MKIAALDIGGTFIKHCLYDSDAPFPKKIEQSPTFAEMGGKLLFEKTVPDILSRMGKFDKIAVSMSGQIDPVSCGVIYATDNIPGLTGINIRDSLKRYFDCPVVAENDVNAAAIGEAVYGAGRGFDDFICVAFGTGIGGAIIRGGRIDHGSSCSSGEFGHMLTHGGGLECTCGSRGCYEQYASTNALIRNAAKATGVTRSGKEIMDSISDPVIRRVVEDWLFETAAGLASLVHIFNPSCIVTGGGIMENEWIIRELNDRVQRMVMNSFRHVKIKGAELGNRAGLMGAIFLSQTGEEK